MSQIEFSAGPFVITCFTDTYPLRAVLKLKCVPAVSMLIESAQLKDLMHVAERMRAAMRQHYLRPGFNMENDANGLE